MGCGDSRDGACIEEFHLTRAEKSLLYHLHTPTEIDFIYRKYSKNGWINENQWTDIHKRLDLAIGGPSPSQEIQGYYKKFQKNNEYLLKEMLVHGIILTDSIAAIKAKLIFEAFDENDAKNLTNSDIFTLCSFLVEVAVEGPSGLVTDPHVNKAEITKFVQNMRAAKEKAKIELQKAFVGGNLTRNSINLNRFIENMTMPSASQLLTLQGIRRMILMQIDTEGKYSALNKKNGKEGDIEKNPDKKIGRILASQFSDVADRISHDFEPDIVRLDDEKFIRLSEGIENKEIEEEYVREELKERKDFEIKKNSEEKNNPSGDCKESMEKQDVLEEDKEYTKEKKGFYTEGAETKLTVAKKVAHRRGLSIQIEDSEPWCEIPNAHSHSPRGLSTYKTSSL